MMAVYKSRAALTKSIPVVARGPPDPWTRTSIETRRYRSDGSFAEAHDNDSKIKQLMRPVHGLINCCLQSPPKRHHSKISQKALDMIPLQI